MNLRFAFVLNAVVAATAVVVIGGASVAVAQDDQPYGGRWKPPAYQPRGVLVPRPPVRKGLTIGVAVGLGELSCEDESTTGTGPCDGVTEAGSLDGHLGLMLSPKVSVGGDLWVMAHKENDLTVSQTIVTAALQLWLTPRLWIKGGLGVAYARFRFNGGIIELESQSETVPAGMLAVGYELMSKPNFALDLSLRGGTGIYEDDQTRAHNVAVTLGLAWY